MGGIVTVVTTIEIDDSVLRQVLWASFTIEDRVRSESYFKSVSRSTFIARPCGRISQGRR